jgi:hypothetical protein
VVQIAYRSRERELIEVPVIEHRLAPATRSLTRHSAAALPAARSLPTHDEALLLLDLGVDRKLRITDRWTQRVARM